MGTPSGAYLWFPSSLPLTHVHVFYILHAVCKWMFLLLSSLETFWNNDVFTVVRLEVFMSVLEINIEWYDCVFVLLLSSICFHTTSQWRNVAFSLVLHNNIINHCFTSNVYLQSVFISIVQEETLTEEFSMRRECRKRLVILQMGTVLRGDTPENCFFLLSFFIWGRRMMRG